LRASLLLPVLLYLSATSNLPSASQVKELKDSHLVVKQKSLLAARELLATPVSYMGCISAGITPAVVALLEVRSHGFDVRHV
jgi:hypothetical protein